MPAPGSSLVFGDRDHIINPKFYKEYIKKTESSIDYKTFVDVIKSSNEEIAKIVSTEPEGFKLPENLGYLAVTMYKSKNRATDYKRSKEHETLVIHNNIHTDGKRVALKWFNTRIVKNIFAKLYKFKGCREFTRAVAKSTKQEVQFLNWTNADFFNYNKVKSLYKTINKRNGIT